MIPASILATNIKKELWSYFSTEAHRDNDIVRYINSAAKALVVARNFDFNQYEYPITITAWTTSYDIPYQIETFFILNSSWEEVEIRDFSWYNRESDKTDIIWIWGDKLSCETPWTYTIFYRWYPTQITSLSDTLNIPEHFYDILIVKATYFWFMDIRAYDKAWVKDNIFKWMIKDMATRSSNPQPLKIKRLNSSKSNTW